MKKASVLCVLFAVLLALVLPGAVSAAGPFTSTLSFGMEGSSEVRELQEFLKGRGFFAGESTGNFFSVTLGAVKAFQASAGIDTTGFFGPLTMAAANAIVLSSAETEARIIPLLLTDREQSQLASVLGASTDFTKAVAWETSQYPIGVGVGINVLRKVSSSPSRFEFVRTLATSTENDGSYSWTPLAGEEGRGDLFIEFVCPSAYAFSAGCSVQGGPMPY